MSRYNKSHPFRFSRSADLVTSSGAFPFRGCRVSQACDPQLKGVEKAHLDPIDPTATLPHIRLPPNSVWHSFQASSIPPNCLPQFSCSAPSPTTWAPTLLVAAGIIYTRTWRTKPGGGGDLVASSKSITSRLSLLSSSATSRLSPI